MLHIAVLQVCRGSLVRVRSEWRILQALGPAELPKNIKGLENEVLGNGRRGMAL